MDGNTTVGGTSEKLRFQQGTNDVALSSHSTKQQREDTVAAPPPRSRFEEEEDAYIAYLEKKLGYGVGKQKKSSFEEDGLDDLLDLADSLAFSTSVRGFDYEEEEDDYDEEESGSDMGFGEEPVEDEAEEMEEEEEEEEWGGIAHSSESESAARYVPPHLRKKQEESESEAVLRLKKQLKGLLNRMSEQNLSSIIDSIEDLYRNNRRHDVTSSITNLVIEGISSHSMLLDSYVVLHAALISSLHKIIGVEFAAHFVQNVVQNYECHHQTLQSSESDPPVESQEQETKGKECSNLMVLLSELYNFQVISSVLVFDLVRQLLQSDLTEFDVELLLKLMRNSGQQLRQDDPSALKDIIDIVQKKVSGKDEKSLSSRTRFMIETLINLKNNRLKRNVTQNQGGEAVERMKKFLSNLSKRKHVLAHDALRVSLEDLHSAESKGKWWLVGAAWGGNPLVEAQESITNVQVNGQATAVHDAASDLLKLARKQGMNTDIRRSIFVVLMSSDDYVDACERLSQLNLTEIQQREIVRVLLHCCGNEKTYNPYYALVCQQLCRQSHSYKITLQFCLWDFLRDMGEVTVGGVEVVKNARDDDGFNLKKISSSRIRNVARAYAWWIAKDVVNLSVLKAVDFTVLKPQSQQFLQALLLQTFISSQSATPLIDASQLPTTRNRAAIEEIFVKATRIENLTMGLVYFLANAFSMQSYEDENIGKFAKWASQLLGCGLHGSEASNQSATPLIDASQLPTTRNRAAIEEIFVKATRIENLTMGLVYFLANAFSKQSYEDENIGKFAKWASQLALDTLRTGVDIIPAL
ncbi:Suppressor of glycerol defect protein 1 [Leucoagaricus sp. SymC.cos]|nr:Suppressor of glycerol defect protein 1 [Leucoagaricus sp. SymC.cos]